MNRKAESADWRLSAFLTSAAGEDPDKKRYSDKQLADARYLLAEKDHALLRSIVTWAHGRTYWAPKVITATKVRRWWDELLADYRAANGSGAGAGEPSKYDGVVENAA